MKKAEATLAVIEAKLHSQSMSKALLPAGDVLEQTLVKLFVFLQSCALGVRSGEEAGLCRAQRNAAGTPRSRVDASALILHTGSPPHTSPACYC